MCGEELEASTPKRRNPRLIIYNVPDELNIENAKELIMKQNSEMCIEKEDITPRYLFKNKRKVNNLVTEVSSMTRMKFLGKKMKLGWNMCNVDYYIRINRSYKCSKFNHRAQDCNGTLTCPLCAENHSLRESKASKEKYKCINCTNFNKYNQKSPVDAKHSSLDNSCSYYQNVAEIQRNHQLLTMHARRRDTVTCFQINLQHSRTATSNLGQLINQHVNITYVQEPYTINNKLAGLPRSHKVYISGDGRKGTAIVINNDQLDVTLIT